MIHSSIHHLIFISTYPSTNISNSLISFQQSSINSSITFIHLLSIIHAPSRHHISSRHHPSKINNPSITYMLIITHLSTYPSNSPIFHVLTKSTHPANRPPIHSPSPHPSIISMWGRITGGWCQRELDMPLLTRTHPRRNIPNASWMKCGGRTEKGTIPYSQQGCKVTFKDWWMAKAWVITEEWHQDRHPENTAPGPMGTIPFLTGGCECEPRSRLSSWTLCLDPGLLKILLGPQGQVSTTGLGAVSMGWVPSGLGAWILVSQAQIKWPVYSKN